MKKTKTLKDFSSPEKRQIKSINNGNSGFNQKNNFCWTSHLKIQAEDSVDYNTNNGNIEEELP